MLAMQTFVRRRYHALLMGLIGLGFVLLTLELLLYRHYQGIQSIGLAARVIGAIVAFLGIRATGSLRRNLALVFLVLSLAGLIGVVEHNEERLGGEERPESARATQQQIQSGGAANQEQPAGGEIPPPVLAPLSMSGFCVLGLVALLAKKDDDER